MPIVIDALLYSRHCAIARHHKTVADSSYIWSGGVVGEINHIKNACFNYDIFMQ